MSPQRPRAISHADTVLLGSAATSPTQLGGTVPHRGMEATMERRSDRVAQHGVGEHGRSYLLVEESVRYRARRNPRATTAPSPRCFGPTIPHRAHRSATSSPIGWTRGVGSTMSSVGTADG